MEITQILDILIGVLFLLAVGIGLYRGLIRMVARFAAVLVAWLAAAVLAGALKERLAEQWLLPALEKQVAQGGLELLPESSLSAVAGQISYVLLFLVIFTIAQLLLIMAINVLEIIDDIPIVGLANRLGGAVAGFFWIFLILCLLGELFFGLLPEDVLKSWGFTAEAIQKTILLKSFVGKS